VKVSREISIGHILQAVVMFFTIALFLMSLAKDRDRMLQTQQDIITWQKEQDVRLYDLEVWKAKMSTAYPLRTDSGTR